MLSQKRKNVSLSFHTVVIDFVLFFCLPFLGGSLSLGEIYRKEVVFVSFGVGFFSRRQLRLFIDLPNMFIDLPILLTFQFYPQKCLSQIRLFQLFTFQICLFHLWLFHLPSKYVYCLSNFVALPISPRKMFAPNTFFPIINLPNMFIDLPILSTFQLWPHKVAASHCCESFSLIMCSISHPPAPTPKRTSVR